MAAPRKPKATRARAGTKTAARGKPGATPKRRARLAPAPEVVDPQTGLSNRQQAFIEQYLICWNASEAARRAGYSPKSARTDGPRMLSNAVISAAIQARFKALHMTADEALARLADHASSSMELFLTVPKGRDVGLIDIRRAREMGVLHLVKKYKIGLQGTSVELYDGQAALKLIGMHHRLFHEGEVSGPDGGPIPVLFTSDDMVKARDRARQHEKERAAGAEKAQAAQQPVQEPARA